MKNSYISNLLLLVVTFLVYSCSTIFSKLASQYEFLSTKYMLYFVGVVLMLFLYAVLWQKVLSFMELNKAFLCKSVTILIVLFFSYFIFGETVTINNLIGASLIIMGLINLAWEK